MPTTPTTSYTSCGYSDATVACQEPAVPGMVWRFAAGNESRSACAKHGRWPAGPLPRTTDKVGDNVYTDLWDFDGLRVGMVVQVTLRFHGRAGRSGVKTYTGPVAWIGRGTNGRIISAQMHTGQASANRDLRWIHRFPYMMPAAEVVA